MQKDFVASFLLHDSLTDSIVYANKVFDGNGYEYPQHNIEDTNKLLNLVRSEFENEGYAVLDVCSIIAMGGRIVWSDNG